MDKGADIGNHPDDKRSSPLGELRGLFRDALKLSLDLFKIMVPVIIAVKILKELDLINRFGVQVIAVKEILPRGLVLIPKADFQIKDSDALIVLGPDETLRKLQEG